ncbi:MULTISPECIES: glutamate-5-semialdehyde dehydrogenase [unclassified Enterococcus]|uniref:glutamate-5-semialdehyde dehydrogenase n=1 Tax=unclassified Enterococcus TaxID=2608891 RepID=UPI0015532A70|nr:MULTISPECIES: glutamate-5-semialdehyde dehydrogenase [unclassified Enterococcus]MBS7576276.1 glutamate-5-semialdehyde dehydrogenase [Enterococcus sp. MMGLQ5-2]MBS7583509.1 glutamate-5-semialdehyde dehydrogenase [Enterococcus sp. MMGLQ5-1]NPD11371.1 glutamate-5-semialdehyde dehydrogenase [Enterococcus sp. MMGLQ5-1]NPD36114.1 glutamate-5-semialdehyde dehydrogenase [Enterococcus sp. MMGLQ5-2]
MNELTQLGQNAKQVINQIARLTTPEKNMALQAIANKIIEKNEFIIAENQKDIENAKANGIDEVMIDRLELNEARLQFLADSLIGVAQLEDPIGEVITGFITEDSLSIDQKRVPLGIIGMIYESRPNVTVDAASLALKTGNAIILRGGKEAFNSNFALVQVMQEALEERKIPKEAIQLVTDTTRQSASDMMRLNQYLDVLIPRGGAGLINAVKENSTVPIIETGTGNCHLFIDESAKLDEAVEILVNAKTQRPSVCNAVESIVVHSAIAEKFLPLAEKALAPWQVEFLADERAAQFLTAATLATDEDFAAEFLDYKLSIKTVDYLDEAITHINQNSTHHSDAIITESYSNSEKFLNEIDSAAVYVNASTRFTDGFMFGFGAEIGISTQKLHARGPMGLKALTTTKYVIRGNGQIRK